jgi:heptaprenyl diphosphate synthase
MREFGDLFDVDRSAQSCRDVIATKTAVQFEFCAWIGSWLAGASHETVDQLKTFGHEFGMAFQMADDILDLAGSQHHTGKPRGKDLEQGVYTLPVIYALEQDADLRRQLASRQPDPLEVADWVVRSSGMTRAIDECLQRAECATAALESVAARSVHASRALNDLLDAAISPVRQWVRSEERSVA